MSNLFRRNKFLVGSESLLVWRKTLWKRIWQRDCGFRPHGECLYGWWADARPSPIPCCLQASSRRVSAVAYGPWWRAASGPLCCTQKRTLGVIRWRRRRLNWVHNTCDGRCAVAKFSKSRVWNKVPEVSTRIFWDTQIPCQNISLICAAVSMEYLVDGISACDRQTDRQTQGHS